MLLLSSRRACAKLLRDLSKLSTVPIVYSIWEEAKYIIIKILRWISLSIAHLNIPHRCFYGYIYFNISPLRIFGSINDYVDWI